MEDIFSQWYVKTGAIGLLTWCLFQMARAFYNDITTERNRARTREDDRLKEDKAEKEALRAEIKAVREQQVEALQRMCAEGQAVIISNTVALQSTVRSSEESAKIVRDALKEVSRAIESLQDDDGSIKFHRPNGLETPPHGHKRQS